MFREPPDLTGGGRAQLERQRTDGHGPRTRLGLRATPAAVAIEAQIGGPPAVGIASVVERTRRRSIDDAVAEALQTRTATDIDELVVAAVVHASDDDVTGGSRYDAPRRRRSITADTAPSRTWNTREPTETRPRGADTGDVGRLAQLVRALA